MNISYPKNKSDWVTTTYGSSFNDNIRFPQGTIFYSNRADGSMKFAYVLDAKLFDGNGVIAESNGMSLISSLVDTDKRKNTWTCGQLKVILPDTKSHVDADFYRKNFQIKET